VACKVLRSVHLLLIIGILVCACAHQPASFEIFIPLKKEHLILNQELFQNFGVVEMGGQGRNNPGRASYSYNFNLQKPDLIHYAYLSIDTHGVDRPANPVLLNGNSIGFLERGAYGDLYSKSYAGEQGSRKRKADARMQRYLPAAYFKSGRNTLEIRQQKVRSTNADGQVSYEKFRIKRINLAVYKIETKKVIPSKSIGKAIGRQFPDQFNFFSALTDEELYIALIKLPFLLAELSDPAGEYANSLSYVYSKIGDYYRWTGFYKKCLDYQRKAERLQSEQPMSFLTAKICTQLALAYYYIGDYHNAVSECEKALKIINTIRTDKDVLASSSKEMTANHLESMVHAYLALNYYHLDRKSDGEYYARRVIHEFDDDWGHYRNRRTEIGKYVPVSLAHQIIGDIALREGRFKDALEQYLKAETILGYEVRPEIYNDQMSIIRLGIAKVHYHLGKNPEARDILEKINSPTNAVMWRSYLLQGMMHESEQDLEKATRKYLAAIAEIEFSRTRITSHGLKINFMTDKQEPYSRMVNCLIQLNRAAEAFDYAEKAKARAFLDLIAETDKVIGQKNEALTQLTLEEKRLRKKLRDIQHQSDMKRRMFNDRGETNETRQKLAEARGALGMFFSRWFSNNKDFASLRSAETIGIKDVQHLIPDNLSLIEYFYHQNKLYTWVITPKSYRIIQRQVAENELVSLIKTFRTLLTRPDRIRGLSLVGRPTSQSVDQKAFTKTNDRLYRLLVEDAILHLSSEKLYIVPHGVLHYLPFQALSNNGQYLIERHQIGYVPSASVLRYVFEAQKSKSMKLFALGNPDLGAPEMNLPHAEQEVHDIRKWFPRAKVLTRQMATEAIFKQEAANFDILHIASHGEFNTKAPLLSCLRLGAGQGEDGRLETQEIFDLDLDAYLVSLSACNTAMGKLTKGDELMGLTRAFIYAGTPSILGTFWSVNDESTMVMMRHFYANLLTMDKFQAIQQSQLAMIRGKRFRHPYYWAGFQMFGNFR
jgi:CHAT domain-containing protein